MQSKKILIIDNDAMYKEYLVARLESFGYDCILMSDYQESIGRLEKESIDAVISDTMSNTRSLVDFKELVSNSVNMDAFFVVDSTGDYSTMHMLRNVGVRHYLSKKYTTFSDISGYIHNVLSN